MNPFKILIPFIIALFPTLIFSQQNFKKGQIRLITGETIHGTSLSVLGQKVSFLDGSSKTEEIMLDEIYYMKVQDGTNIGKGAAMGFGISAGFILGEVIYTSLSSDREFRDNAFLNSLAFVAGGTLLGTIIGEMSPKTRTIYEPAQHFKEDISFSMGITQNGIGVVAVF